MRCIIFIIFLLIIKPVISQNWVDVGLFNRSINVLYSDSVSNELFIGGTFCFVNNDTMVGMAKWNGHQLTTLGCGVEWNCNTTGISGYCSPVSSFVRFNNHIFVTGSFTYAGNKTVNGITYWNGSEWINFGTGLKFIDGTGGMGAKLKVINNELYLCGVFDSIAGIPVNGIAKYNGTNWSAVHDFPIIPTWQGGMNRIHDIELYKNELYVCGIFDNLPIGTIFNIVKWDGNNWVSVGNGIRGTFVVVSSMLVYKNELIVAGMFSKSAYQNNPGENIGKWDGTHWTELASGTDDGIWDIKVHNDILYACGTFEHAGGIPADEIAKWDGIKWCGLGTNFDNALGTLDFYRDTLYIGGGFWHINGADIQFLAKWTGGNYVDTCSNTTSIAEIENTMGVYSVYPNPFSEFSVIDFPQPLTKASLIIYDVLGKEVQHKEGLSGKEITISRGSMSNGLYFYRVIDGNIIIGQGKFVVE